ncbi:hypothetical protein BHYA_0306g00150 [Botrytis hyacinthi]|uniref:Major facilitator superfamily (MFS) profile domain-containing protein n=1 Tax=Botrytis hyacinthi TaxID=278943 RepID=A0A4Z1GB14_9HELO|nr:hypothetical protein BHYA_0306g00150 [Botrytis hyacinthi]
MVRYSQHEEGRVQVPLLEGSQTSDSPSPSMSEVKLKWLVWCLVGILVLTFETGIAIRTAPLIASYKEILCTKTIQHDMKSPAHCTKDHTVTSELAMILGVSQLLECLPVLLLSGIYGSMADKYGPRPILFLSYLGLVLSSAWVTGVIWLAPMIPLRLVFIGPIFTVIGGGPSVPISILMTSAVAVAPSIQKVSIFSFIHGTALIAVILGFGLGSAMMIPMGNYPPLLAGLVLMCLALSLSLLLPISKPMARLSSTVSEETSAHARPDASTPLMHKISIGKQTMSKSFDTLWHMRGVIPLLFTSFLCMLGQNVQILILQYMPERFGIGFAQANTFNILNSTVNLFVLFIALPLVGTLVLRSGSYNAFHKDMILALSSSLLLFLGALVLGIAPDIKLAVIGIIIFGTGIGLSSLLRSIFMELFPPEHAAFAITLISTVKNLGSTFSGPVYSYTFALSLNLGGRFQGLPFFVSAICFVIGGVLLIATKKKLIDRPEK